MSSKPNARYDWNKYMPRMVELYQTGMSIPKIHAEIQEPADGFTPSQRIVYEKLRSEGYSTKYTRASLLHPVKTSMVAVRVAGKDDGRNVQVLTLPPSTITQTILRPQNNYLSCEIGNNNYHHQNSEVGRTQYHMPINGQGLGQSLDGFGLSTNALEHQNVRDSGPPATDYFDMAWSDMPLDSEFVGQIVNPDPWVAQIPYSTLNMNRPGSGLIAVPEADMSRWSMETDIDVGLESVTNSSMPAEVHTQNSTVNQKRHRNTLDTTPLPDRSSKRNSSPAESIASRPVSWATSKRGFKRSVSPDNRLSTGSPRDSGYVSGRSSLLVSIAEDTPPHLDSLREFNGLYRVPCHGLHEPQLSNDPSKALFKDIFKNTASCEHCLYSGIHNLSWSAQNLTLQEFQVELRRDRLYNIIAVDAAGNSALHYAAAGGASYEHFLTLIESGVNPYQINTVGQLFLHCMWPGSDSGDDEAIALFTFDLVNLLNSLEPRGAVAALRWRDNEGRTVLDAIAARITSHDVTTRTFQAVKNAGYPLEMSQLFDIHQLRHRSSNLQQLTSESNEGRSPLTAKAGFVLNDKRQKSAYEIFGRATDEPSYVDPDTGDNILHALARMRVSEKGSLLSRIRNFISKDVDLNVNNQEKDTPLTAFIRERPFSGVECDETGATMSKYLDALLWKDARLRLPNKINVNLKNREGATALYYAAVRARPDSVRSLIEAGANVNSRIDINGHLVSILQATRNAKAGVVSDKLKVHLFDNVISYLEHDGAVPDPTVMKERALCDNSVRIMPM